MIQSGGLKEQFVFISHSCAVCWALLGEGSSHEVPGNVTVSYWGKLGMCWQLTSLTWPLLVASRDFLTTWQCQSS